MLFLPTYLSAPTCILAERFSALLLHLSLPPFAKLLHDFRLAGFADGAIIPEGHIDTLVAEILRGGLEFLGRPATLFDELPKCFAEGVGVGIWKI
jgi:hypothetical protein